MKGFTKAQISEIEELIDIRIDTISDDPDSADEFEKKPNSLNDLKYKILNGIMEFTEEEVIFLKEELNVRINVAYDIRANEGISGNGLINLINNAKDKL